MSLINAQIRASIYWRQDRKKISPLQGQIKQMMLRGAHGRPCPICNTKMLYYPKITVDHSMPSAATIEHILPRSLGGNHDKENLATICNGCNRSRGMVYPSIKDLDDVRNYVAWLFLQLERPEAAEEQFPIEQSWFCFHWKGLYKTEYKPPVHQLRLTQNKKRRVLDMSANARSRNFRKGI